MDGARMLGEILTEDEGVSAGAVASALDSQRAARGRKRLGTLLVEMGEVKAERLARAVATQFGLRYVDPLREPVDPVALWKLPRDVAERHRAIPLKGQSGLVLAMSEPRSAPAVRELAGLLGVAAPVVAVASEERILEAIRRHYDTSPAVARAFQKLTPDERPPVLSPTGMELDTRAILARLKRGPGKPVVDVAIALLAHAVELGSRELRIESGIVRHVYDGVSTDVMEIPAAMTSMLVARLKVVAGLEPGESRRSVVARMSIAIGERTVPTIASAGPGPAGGALVIRFASSLRRTADLGMSPAVESAWSGLSRGHGLVLLVGPEGSGCASTATAAGVPVMLLRDAESVANALAAVERGELVFGRVHTHGIPEAIARLRELGAPGTVLALTLRGALHQRLVRRVCAWCSPGMGSEQVGAHGACAPEFAPEHGASTFLAPVAGPGCPSCRYRGTDGLRALFELVVVDDALREAIADGAPLRRIGECAVAVGRRCIRTVAMDRAAAGEVAASEIHRNVPARPSWSWPKAAAVEPRAVGLSAAPRLRPVPTGAAAAPMQVVAAPDVVAPAIHAVTGGRASACAVARPAALVLHADILARGAVAEAFGERVDVRFVWSPAAVRGAMEAEAPAVALVALSDARGLVAALRDRGVRVVVIGEAGGVDEIRAAFAMGADDYGATVIEAAVRASRWVAAA